MDIGLLWYDDDPTRDLEARVVRAVEHYRGKYGEEPTLGYAHPATASFGDSERQFGALTLRPSRIVPANNIWLGNNDDSESFTIRLAKARRQRH